jgi:hypothetical protein
MIIISEEVELKSIDGTVVGIIDGSVEGDTNDMQNGLDTGKAVGGVMKKGKQMNQRKGN